MLQLVLRNRKFRQYFRESFAKISFNLYENLPHYSKFLQKL